MGFAFHFCVGLVLVIVLTAAVHGIDGLAGLWALCSLVPTLLLLLALGWSLATIFGLVNVRFRDATHLTEIGFQTLFYLTPIIYEPRLLKQRGLGFLVHANPVVPFLELLRVPLLDGRWPDPSTFATAGLIVVVCMIAAAGLLHREERRLIFLL